MHTSLSILRTYLWEKLSLKFYELKTKYTKKVEFSVAEKGERRTQILVPVLETPLLPVPVPALVDMPYYYQVVE